MRRPWLAPRWEFTTLGLHKILLVVLLEVVESVYHVLEPVHVVSVDVPVPQVPITRVLGVTHLKRRQNYKSYMNFYSTEIGIYTI